MTTRRSGGIAAVGALALALGACGGSGGELAEETERRRAELAARDSAARAEAARDSAEKAAGDGADYEIPAFLDDSVPGATPVDTAPAPGAGQPPAPPAPGQPPAPPARPAQDTSSWTVGARRSGGPSRGIATLRGVRIARHPGFDRLVMDFGPDPLPGYHVEYVDRPVVQCGSGDPTPVAGDGWLLIRLRDTRAHDDDGRATVSNREQALRLPVLREMEMVCDFEALVEVVLGVARPNPYRVLTLSAPNRLIVDVRH